MVELEGYEVVATIAAGDRTVLVRARRAADGVPVIVKLLRAEHSTPEDVQRLRHEFEIASGLGLPGTVHPYGVERFGHRVGLVLEDFGGRPLDSLIGPRGMELGVFLSVAVSLADTLARLHAGGVIHKDVKPSNILVDLSVPVVKIADFGLASRLSDQTDGPRRLEGTLAYLSPEQTGRMDRAVDHRSDLYSLGATFYEMLTGEVPFPTEDALELVHCHLAVRPTPPATRNPDVPAVVSDIVLKLLAKQPEDRYQSAFGLRCDLAACLDQWESKGDLAPFPLGLRDVAGHFSVPDRLYGREAEVEAIVNSFERVSLGGSAVVLLTGAPGVGKSALVGAAEEPIAGRGGYLVEGKFDQYARPMPYAALIAALRQLVGRLLGEPPERVAAWRTKLLDALGQNVGVVTEVVPELALVTGETPPPPAVGPTEAQNRFNLVFRQFLGLFAQPEHPLVLFLDDLQWADVDSLRLLRTLLTDPDAAHLLVLGAYRPEDVGESHPLALTLGDLSATPLHRIEVEPLPHEPVGALVADTLGASPEEVVPLAALVHQRTGGNPFFLRQLLQSFHEDGLIRFAPVDGRWAWDLAALERQGTTEGVVELMASRVANLVPPTQEALRVAAVIGNRFDVATLALALGRSPESTTEVLGDAVRAGLVLLPVEGAPGARGVPDIDDPAALEYRFLHDRVQQACHSAIRPLELPVLHLRVGRMLLDRLRKSHDDEDLFAVTGHLNAAVELISDPASRLELAELNLAAARKAKSATAYESASLHLSSALALLPEDPWSEVYDLAFELHLLQGEVLATLGDLEGSEALFDAVVGHAQTAMERARACQVRAEVLHCAGRPAESYPVARAGLGELGVAFPPSPEAAAAETAELMHRLLDPAVVARLEALGPGDERAALSDHLFLTAAAGAYFSRPEDLGLVIGKHVDHVLQAGATAHSAMGPALFGMMAFMRGHLELGIAYAEAALDLARKADPYLRGRVQGIAWCMCLAWRHSFEASAAAFREAFLLGHSAGDLQWAMYALLHEYIALLMAGRDQQDILQAAERWLDYCVKFVPLESGQARIRVDVARTLMDLERDPVDAEGIIAGYAEKQNFTDVCESLIELARIETLFGDWRAAYDHSVRAEPYMEAGAAGTLLFNFSFWVHFALSCARLAATAEDVSTASPYLAKADDIIARLRPYVELAPDNFASYVSLVEAERARATGDLEAATLAYLRTIGHAGAHRYLLLEAFAHELLGRLLREQGYRFAAAHFREARSIYLECGARGKALQLEAEMPELAAPAGRRPGDRRSTSTSTETTGERLSQLDLDSVLKASEAIVGETAYERVVARLIGVAVESAGAERAVFVSVEGDALAVEAERRAGTGEIIDHRSTPLEAAGDVVLARVVRYVARTGEAVVVGDAAGWKRFLAEAEHEGRAPKSLLVLPIARHGPPSGILYLENDLVAGAFTPNRLELLQVLSAQMAISLENARLYGHLEEKVDARTRELTETLENLRAMQRQVVESEKLAALGSLVAGVAHEINTPVGIAVTAASNIAERTAELRAAFADGSLKRSGLESFIEVAEESSHLVEANLQRASDLVASFKQVAVDQSSEAQRTFEVRRYLEDILQSLRPKLKRSPHAIEIDCNPELTITSYPGAIAQVVTNLVMNSLIHAYAEGEAGTLRLAASGSDGGVRLVYADDGRGVSPEVTKRMFDPFFTTRRGHGGSGLGLHIVHNLVTQRLGGQLSVRSAPGEGTEFTIDIPDATGGARHA